MNRHHPLAAPALLVMVGSLAAAHSHEAQTQIGVGATVLAVARLQIQSAPTEILLSSADLRRGFIDVAEPTTLVVRSNSPAGFALDLMTAGPLISSMIIQGLGSQQSLGAEGGTLVQRWQSPGTVSLALRFRLVLKPGLSAGRYPWPLQVAVRPLDTPAA